MSLSSAQQSVRRHQREIESLNKKLADLSKEEASLSGKIASIMSGLSRATPAQAASRQREIASIQTAISRLHDKKADVTKGISKETEWLHRSQQDLMKEQAREQKKVLDSLTEQQSLRTRAAVDSFAGFARVAAATPTRYDAFISHATEDKEELVRPLAEALRALGHSIWYDEFQLTVGDSLRRSIDKGLAQSRFGIVVLSPSFFSKQWPQYELDGLVAKEISGGKVILPLWHKVSKNEVIGYSPTLADKMALNTAMFATSELAAELSSVLRGHA